MCKSKYLVVLILIGLFTFVSAANWDTLRIKQFGGTTSSLRDVAIGNKLKGATDDTNRIFTVQSSTPYNVALLTDTGVSSMKWMCESLEYTTGYRGVAIGDVDQDGDNDLLYGRSSTPYRLKRRFWNGSTWAVETIMGATGPISFPGGIYDIAIGDAKNDGSADDIFLGTSTNLFYVHWNGVYYDTTKIFASAGSCYGVAIGDFDAGFSGNEVAVASYSERVYRVTWRGAWFVDTIYTGAILAFYDVAIGNFDASNPGSEIAISNGASYATSGAVIELYGSGSSWTSRGLWFPAAGWTGFGEIAVGDFYYENPGDEILAVAGGTSYEAAVVYGSGTTWNYERAFQALGPLTSPYTYGCVIGDVNRHRTDTYGTEFVVTGGNGVFVGNQHMSSVDYGVIYVNVPQFNPTHTNLTIKAAVRCHGLNAQGLGVPVKYTITGPLGYTHSDIDQATLTGLSFGQVETITFTPDWYVPDTLCTYTIKAWTELAGDDTPLNDTFTMNFTVYRNGGMIESFTGTSFPPPGWTVYNFYTTADDAWVRYTSYFYTSPACARINYDVPNNDWLITPKLIVQNGDYLKFWYRIGSITWPETCYIRISTAATPADTSTFVVVDSVLSNTLTWYEKVIDLSAYAGQNIYVAFYYECDNNYGFAIDDVTGPLMYTFDAAVTAITRPYTTEEKRVEFTPQVTINNYGSGTENIPVVAEIWEGTPAPIDNKNSGSVPNLAKADICDNRGFAAPKESPDIDYYVAWTVTTPENWSALGVTAVYDTLLWLSASNSGLGYNKIFIYNLKTQAWVDSFSQGTAGWGYRDLCFLNGYVYGGREGYVAQINPNPPYSITEYAVTGVACLRALTDNDVADSLWTANWASKIYKLSTRGGSLTDSFANIYSLYGLAYDPYHNCFWGSSQTVGAEIVKYSYPDLAVLDYGPFPELETRIAGGCEIYKDKYLLYVGQSDKIYCISFELAYRDTLTVSVAPGDVATEVYFRPCTLMTAAGNYQFKAYTNLFGDGNSTNDMLSRDLALEASPITLSAPTNGLLTTNNAPTFDWSDVTNVTQYRIQVDNDADFLSPEINEVTANSEWSVLPGNELADGTYYWHARAEGPGTPDDYSEVWTLTIDNQGPVPPVLVLPEDGAVLETATPSFTWESVGDAVLYNLVVDDGTKAEVINIETSELTYTPTTGLDEGSFTWTVRAKDAVENWGVPSAPWSFSISLGTPGWASVESVPAALDLKAGKYVKDGGAMVAGGGTKDGDDIYMFPGNKSWYFYKYTRGTPGTFTTLESIPYGVKVTDPLKINKKKIGKGAALCYDGTSIIYATKGNGTTELWAYDILANTWTAKAFVPVPKALKGGTSIAYLDGKVYLLAGGQKKTDLVNFYVYDIATDAWSPSGLLTLGPNIKIWKDGACLTVLDGTLYALKSNDKYNPFFSYNVLTNTWTEFDSIPMLDSVAGKAKKIAVKDGGAICAGGGAIYAIKGGGAQLFWKYTTLGGWTRQDTIPRLHKKSVPKTGAALAFANNRIFLMKGNNSREFFCYTRSVLNATRPTPTTVVSTMVEKTNLTNVFSFNVAPNPFNRTTIIRYTVPVAGKVSVKLYNTSGRVVETVNNSYLNAGNYTTTLNASTLASGVYFLRYEDRTNRAEIKLIVE